MKVIYRDQNKNHKKVFLEDNRNCIVRMVFNDSGSYYIVVTDDLTNQMYLNRLLDIHHKPHMFFASNMEAIEDDEEFYTLYAKIDNLSNFQANKEGEVEDTDLWVPTFTVSN